MRTSWGSPSKGWPDFNCKEARKRVYLAGPMRGIKDFNFPAFFQAEHELRLAGWDVFNPAKVDVESGFNNVSEDGTLDGTFDMREVCLRDVHGLLSCDAVYMLAGWSNSKGATAERAIALWVGLDVLGAAA